MSTCNPLNRMDLGREAEVTAKKYLLGQGLNVVLENFRCRTGELDLIALQENVLVVVEVRMRTQMNYANAAASVGPRKQARIISATKYLLLTRPQLRRYPVRFDVVALDRAMPGDDSRIEWIRNAFQARSW